MNSRLPFASSTFLLKDFLHYSDFGIDTFHAVNLINCVIRTNFIANFSLVNSNANMQLGIISHKRRPLQTHSNSIYFILT